MNQLYAEDNIRMDESIEGEEAVLFHILHCCDQGIVVYVECQLLIKK